MKHAILLLWHKNMDQLKRLIVCFDKDFVFYVHIDKKVPVPCEEAEELKKLHPHIHIYSKYKIYWGGIGILKAELFLLEEIVKHGVCDYIHFMSGQDYPIKRVEYIKEYFKNFRGYEFIEYMPLPDKRWEQGSYMRFDLFRLNDYMDYNTPRGRKCINLLNRLQLSIGYRRRIPNQFNQLYGGSNWMSITYACAKYVVEHRKEHKSFYNRLRFTFASDEVYFHTVILNSTFASHVINDNRRLIQRDGPSGLLVTLTEQYWWEVVTSNRLFARKIEAGVSDKLVEYLHDYVLRDEKIPIAEAGYWESKTLTGHAYDNGLGEGILKLLPYLQVNTVADFGCGPGWYVALLFRHGYDVQGYDGNPNVEQTSALFFGNGFHCLAVDLTEEVEAEEPFDIVISLEVGEHIAPKWEDIFLENLTSNASKYILLSWAVENQKGDGHVNCRSNEYICDKMRLLGFILNPLAGCYLRECASLCWFKKTLMLFQKF